MSAIAAANTDLDVARSVLGIEAAGLRALAASLDTNFDRAVTLLAGCTGRIAVSGMGKSGHVARKTAATLASTGSPAYFVHPAEASHGDLGMVQPGDALVLFSNSGETTELADLVAHAHRFNMPLIAVTGRAGSTLALAADVVLLLPSAPEACAVTSAPTTSTTMQMALGDALAVVLLTRRGFTATDFRSYHPGGRLGAQLRRVGDIMHVGEAVPLAEPAMPMQQALLLMTGKGFGCVGVVERSRLIGIVTDGDLRRAMGPGLLDQPVRAVMTANPRTIRPDALAGDALWTMNEGERRITSLFVVDALGAPVGIVHVHDLLRAGVV
jgi:arabinose-5-phosphate isomerase